PRWDPFDELVDGFERGPAQRRFCFQRCLGISLVRLKPGTKYSGRRVRLEADGLVERNEPLRRRKKDDRVVATPAVGIRMRERLAVPQAAAVLQCLLDLRVRIEHAHAADELDGV